MRPSLSVWNAEAGLPSIALLCSAEKGQPRAYFLEAKPSLALSSLVLPVACQNVVKSCFRVSAIGRKKMLLGYVLQLSLP